MNDVRVLIDPILALLRSRKVAVGIAGFVASVLVPVLVQYAPALAGFEVEIGGAIVVLCLALIGAIAYEDGAEKAAGIFLPEGEIVADISEEQLREVVAREIERRENAAKAIYNQQ